MEQKFIEGVKAFKPKADFIKAEIVITPNVLVQFLKDNPDFLTEYNGEKQLKVQIKESQKGTWYASLNEYKPKNQTPYQKAAEQNSDLPF